MRRIFCLATILWSVLCSSSVAWADRKPDVEVVADLERLVAATPDGAKNWTVLKNAAVRHNNSGLVCGGTIGDIPLVELKGMPGSPIPDGHVDCHYASPGVSGVYDVSAFSPDKALSPEEAFDAWRQIIIAGPNKAVPLKELSGFNARVTKGEAFLITVDGKPRYTFLYVGTVHNWVVTVRFTTVPQPERDQAEAALMAGYIATFPDAITYRAMRGVTAKQLNMPEPASGF